MVVEDFQSFRRVVRSKWNKNPDLGGSSIFKKMVSENPYEVVKDGSTNPGATGAVEPFVAVSQVDSKTGEEAARAETETGE